MHQLPINDVLDEIKATLSSHNRVVLQAPPGAGKTTVVPIELLDQPWLDSKQIIVLEPRRIAARNAASRMASLLNEKLGETVGYQIRQESCFSDKTRILVVTEGILTRKLQADPEQKNTALIIFDEFHERSLHADLSLALCLQSQQILHENLKILVMSATLNTSAISELLDNAPIIQSEGRSYPVTVKYLDKPLKPLANNYASQQQLIQQLAITVKQAITEQSGSCLVFLPGVKEINQLMLKLKPFVEGYKNEKILLAPLHGSLSRQQQDQAILAAEKGIRKIVLATNIAETSLTIEGIRCVIDSGYERIQEFKPATAMNGLITRFISEDSATQRSGRAGRLSAGVCYRLWTSQQQQRLLKHTLAEVLHSDLTSLVLELANWGVQQVDELQWMDIPPLSAVEQAGELLQQLNAVNAQGVITPHGSKMLTLGAHPRLAHMMLSAVGLHQAYHACLIAAMLTEKDFFQSQSAKSFDIHERLILLRNFKSTNSKHKDINYQQCKIILQSANDFFRRLKRCKPEITKTEVEVQYAGVILAFAYADRIAKLRRSDEARYLLSNGKGVFIPDFLQHHLYKFLVIANLDIKPGNMSRGEAMVYLAAEVSEQQLDEYFEELIEVKDSVSWNETAQRVESKQVKRIGKIVLQEKLNQSVNREMINCCLLQAIKVIGLECLSWSCQAVSLKQRVEFIHTHSLNNDRLSALFHDEPLSDFSSATLLDSLSVWLQPHLTTENSIKQCQKLDLYKILQSQLSWKQQQLINELAPESITVPSGSSIKIDYSDVNQPVLAVRLQEVFGLYETPTLLNGLCSLMMHLLSPARRPMQVTKDLNSFWKTTYHEVKKELRGKYKRHYWPDDPFTAQATSKTKKNMHK